MPHVPSPLEAGWWQASSASSSRHVLLSVLPWLGSDISQWSAQAHGQWIRHLGASFPLCQPPGCAGGGHLLKHARGFEIRDERRECGRSQPLPWPLWAALLLLAHTQAWRKATQQRPAHQPHGRCPIPPLWSPQTDLRAWSQGSERPLPGLTLLWHLSRPRQRGLLVRATDMAVGL